MNLDPDGMQSRVPNTFPVNELRFQLKEQKK